MLLQVHPARTTLPREVCTLHTLHQTLSHSASSTVGTYTNYPSTYAGGYGAGRYGGFYGAYNPAFLYWAIIPSFAYLGFAGTYHRYNSHDGAYYAPELIVSGSNTNNVVINGTENSSNEDNYYYSFNLTTQYEYPMADHAYFASSDPQTNPSDFSYRLGFMKLFEFDDANQNGVYDDNERVGQQTSLEHLAWQPLAVTNQTAPNNASQPFKQVSTMASNVTRDDGSAFTVYLTWRSSNLQINGTGGVPMEPFSLWYNLTLDGYSNNNNSSGMANLRLAVVQVLTTPQYTHLQFDVNSTTPANIAAQIKTNETYGLSIGNYSEGRLEYPNNVGISQSNNQTNEDSNPNTWVWPSSQKRQVTSLVITLPPLNGSSSPSLTGFGYLDVDVMNAAASSGGQALISLSSMVRPWTTTLLLASVSFILAL